MAGDRMDKLKSSDWRPSLQTPSGAPDARPGPGGFCLAGPLGLHDVMGMPPHPLLSPAGRYHIASPPKSVSDVALDYGPRALYPVLSAHTLRVLRSILRAAGQTHVYILSTSRTPVDDARVAFMYFEKQDFADPKRRTAIDDPLLKVYLQAKDDDESPAEILDDLEDKLAELGPLYVGKYRRAGTLLDIVNIAPDSIRSPQTFVKAVTADSRVEHFLVLPLSPHYHLEIPQPRAAGSGKDGAGSAPDAPPPPPKTKAKTWIEFKVIEDGTGKPVGGVRLRVTTPDGIENFFTADSAGLIRIEDLDPGKCDIGEMTDADALEVVSIQ
jgi:hypothetical protein